MLTKSLQSCRFTLALFSAILVASHAAGNDTANDSQACPPRWFDYSSCADSNKWCGFDTFQLTTPKIKYLTNTTTYIPYGATNSFVDVDTEKTYGLKASCPGTVGFSVTVTWPPGTTVSVTCGAEYIGSTTQYFQTTFNNSTSGSGSFSVGGHSITQGGSPYISTSFGTVMSGAFTFDPSPLDGILELSYSPDTTNTCILITNKINGGLSTNVVGLKTVPDTNSPTELQYTNQPNYTPISQFVRLTGPYTRIDVELKILNRLVNCPTAPLMPKIEWADNSLVGDVITLTKVKYRIGFDSEPNATYVLHWRDIINYEDGSAPGEILHAEEVQSTDVKSYVTNMAMLPPLGVDGQTRLDEGSVVIIRLDSGGGGCCVGDNSPSGGGGSDIGSIHSWFNLGTGLYDRFGARLYIKQETLDSSSSTPAALHFAGDTRFFEVINSAQGIRQVKGNQCLANVITNDLYSYALHFYELTNVGAKGGDGLYTVVNSPFVVWTVRNPDGASATTRLQVIETRGTKSITNEYNWSAANQTWSLLSGNGLRLKTKHVDWDGTAMIRTETVQIYTGTNLLVAQDIKKFKVFSFGTALIEHRIGGPGQEITTTNTYYTSGNGKGQINETTHSDGSWSKLVYDSYGRVQTRHQSCFTSQGPTDNSTVNRRFDILYGPITGSGDDSTFTNEEPRQIYGNLFGNQISRTYLIRKPGQRIDIQDPFVAGWSSVQALSTTNNYYTNGSFIHYLKSTFFPDGTVSVYFYETNATQSTVVLLNGQPDPSNQTNILEGTKTVTLVAINGQPLSKTVYAFPQTSIILSQETYSDFDNLYRPGRVTHLDGTYQLTTYDCCGIQSVTDRDGTVTAYTYDDLKRLVTEIRNGITTISTYDGADRRLTMTRQGTDSSLVYLDRSGYDLAGRLIVQTNALGYITTYSEAIVNDLLVKTVIFPDSSTRTNTYGRDGSILEISGTAASPKRYQYGVILDGTRKEFILEIQLDANGGTNEWVQTINDGMGRVYKRVFAAASAPYPFEQSSYSIRGQLTNRLDADGVIMMYRFNGKGEQTHTILSSNADYVIDYAGNDRITFTTNDVVVDNGTNVRRTRVYVWNTSANASNLVSTAETSTDGLQSWTTIWNNAAAITSHRQTFFDATHGLQIITNTAPDNSYTVTTNQYTRLISVTHRDANGALLSQVIYGYDPHGRQVSVSDARNGTTTNLFNDADQLTGIKTPVPGAGQSAQVTTFYLDNMGRIWKSTLPDSTSVTNEYFPTGLLKKTYGSRTYPVEYTYDAQGRMLTMKTWQNFSGNTGGATTTWNYDIYRGWLTNKTYDGGATGPTYTYTPAGRLQTRLWARGTNTTYSYNKAGDLARVVYNDGATPAITNGYDRLSRQTATTNGTSVTLFNYGDANQVLSERYLAGPLAGLTVSNIYDALLRRTTNGLWNGSSWLTQTRYTYDSASRLKTVGDGTAFAGYDYVANSSLVGQISFTNSGVQRMVTAKQYDLLNRLTNITSTAGGSTVAGFVYQNNDANQRTRRTESDGSYWVYTYDALGQVTSGKKYWSDDSPVAGQQFEYTFDDIGNRKTTAAGGDDAGANLRSATYSPNNLNQYTSRTVPGYLNMLGTARTNATISLWTDTGAYAATTRKGEYFRGELSVDNSSAALWLTVTNLAVLNDGGNPDIVTNTVGKAFVAKTPEPYFYDADGDLTSDGRWTNSWNGENRLISMVSLTNAPSNAKRRLMFGYDHQGRRITKSVENWTGSAWSMTLSNKFVYDGWNLIAELNATNNAVIRSYMWGLDMTGALQWSEGVGGLLALNDSAQGPHFLALDGNGNVVALINASGAASLGHYEYGPFGEVIRITGLSAQTNPIRFAAKYHDDETDLLYFGLRSYSLNSGRWISRDPIGEEGGRGLYAFTLNHPPSGTDSLGLKTIELEFNAFIPANKGVAASTWFGAAIDPILAANDLRGLTWIDEPGGTLWITSTSGRGPGGGSSKVKTIVSSFDSRRIGKLMPLHLTEVTTSDLSHRIRRNGLGLGSGFVVQTLRGIVRSHSIAVKDLNSCKSEIRIAASGEYPFNVGGLWGALVPNIDYSVTYTLERITSATWEISLTGEHNDFPDYEARVMSFWIYHFAAPASGPGSINLNTSTEFSTGLGAFH